MSSLARSCDLQIGFSFLVLSDDTGTELIV